MRANRRSQLENQSRHFLIAKLWLYGKAGAVYRDVSKETAIERLLQYEAGAKPYNVIGVTDSHKID